MEIATFQSARFASVTSSMKSSAVVRRGVVLWPRLATFLFTFFG